MKICKRCSQEKPLDAFLPDPRYRGGRRHECRPCYQSRKIESQTRGHLRRTYGLTLEAWQAIWDAQDGRCAVCRKPETTASRATPWAIPKHARLAVDHDHTTGVVRGLLCRRCNVGIGQLDDDVDRLRAALDYLISHSQKETQHA